MAVAFYYTIETVNEIYLYSPIREYAICIQLRPDIELALQYIYTKLWTRAVAYCIVLKIEYRKFTCKHCGKYRQYRIVIGYTDIRILNSYFVFPSTY